MSPKALSSSFSHFLRRFSLVAILASIVLLLLSGYAASKLYERYVVRLAESNAINLTEAIFTTYQSDLNSALNSAPLLPPQLLALNKTLRDFIQPYGIVKIKLFAPSGIIIYSTDLSIIGKDASANEMLQQALIRGASSNIQRKDQIRDLANETRFDVDVVESYVAMRNQKGVLIGVFEIYQDTSGFRGEVQQGIILFVGVLAIILLSVFGTAYVFMRKAVKKMIYQQEMLEELATVDAVTGLYNRAEITRRMEAEWQRYKRSTSKQTSFALLMLDLDHFKRVNDNYGHQVGDKLLQLVAHRLMGELRSYSSIGRYGGEEFIALIPDISYVAAQQVAERLQRLVSQSEYALFGHKLSISISIGFAVAEPTDLNLDALIKRVDDALYEAKRSGRSCVVGAVGATPEKVVIKGKKV
ncbi:GGDEF domain-containing protein [Neptuniibacter sp. PT8_73]|uniref:GGDEF domain-containing protein n=1 Tax=unclassified Neptuniibacter TaxID=2630693 RepID=UPI0039F70595